MSSAVVPAVGIWQLLFQRHRPPFPDTHVIFQDGASQKSYTYNDLRTLSERFGLALRSQWSWNKGDVLVLMSSNCIETPLVTWGCHYNGGIVAPVNPGLSPRELEQQLLRSQAKAMVVHPSCLSTALEAAKLANLPTERVLVLGETRDGNGLATVSQFIEDFAKALHSTPGPIDVEPDDVAFLVYSSGTTGLPKGVMVSHRNVVADVVLQAEIEGPHTSWVKDRTLAVLPTYHIYGLICLVHLPVWLGTTTVYMEKFDLQTFCRLIHEHSITHVYVAPPVVLHLAKNRAINQSDIASLRMITSGGAPLGAALIHETYNRWKIPVRQAYGLSETTSVSHIQRWDTWSNGIGSNGPVLPGIESKIALPDASVAPANVEGELWIRGPTVFNGYMNDTASTTACLTSDRWFRTGDIGFEDEIGNLHITDRAKDMIKFKGFQIAPTELEDILLDHATVSDAAVIGVWNEEMQTEVPLAYIVRKGKEGVEEGDSVAVALSIMEHLKAKVVHYKHLRGGVIWIEKIPKSPSGKILKRELRDRVRTVDKVRQIVAPEYAHYRASKL
ncbi:hypothetical protein BJY01DRAFT_259692 [Aspergillus pseudoustus]|uniref:Acetyl-CoA synthetase-like protein n=1 Tax=Aspergillus pseudoustus TaxID=1810923 RepID=A0ABR4J237_9EURO